LNVGSSFVGPHPQQHQQDACAVVYADNGNIKAKLSIALEVKEDAGLALNFNKTTILVKGISAADAHALPHSACSMPIPPSRTSVPMLSPASFVVDGYIRLGVPIGTDAFIQHFVKDKCPAIMEGVEASSTYQRIRFAKRPGCNISTAMCSSRTTTCYNNNTLTTRSPTPS
jgi:hypothetical protein